MFPIRFNTPLAIIGLVLTALAFEAPAAELRLTLANDPVSGNQRKDDLYTSETALELVFSSRRAVFTERMFTNREEGYRFDETRLGITFAPTTLFGWSSTSELGILHVGRGLLGESVQNGVHRFVGSDEVHLRYVEDESFHPTAALSLSRRIATLGDMPLRVDVRMETAPAFRSSITSRIGLERRLGHGAQIEAGVGIRADNVENRWLEGVVDKAGPTADVTLSWRGVALTVSHNRYGTSSRHVTLGWRASLAR